jgi:phosphoenolpyruvate carboxylase
VRSVVFGAIAAEHERTVGAVLLATGAGSLLESQPSLAASLRSRSAYLDPLNVCQVELLRAVRGGQHEEKLLRGIHLSINGVASGLRNSG